MATTFTAQIERFAEMAKADMLYVAKSSISDVLVAAQTTQIGITQGATSFEVGKIPVGETAELVNSLSVDGGAEGELAYVTAISGMDLGDTLRFAWSAPHAMPIEAGWTAVNGTNVLGRHFVGANAARFSEFVAGRVAEVKK